MSEANTIPPFRSVTEEYLSLISGMVNAFAHHRIITDENGIPIDYVFLEVNEAFERMTGLSREEVLGKRVTEVLPGIDEEDFNWIKEYGKVALTGKRQTFEQYSEVLNRWYSVAAFSPLRGEFVTVFNEITDYVKNKQRLEDELQ
ncbi:MAG: PAS domain S-box protein, partial [Candidatus Thorarchaeota archaeon]|nr:PAS domain S-box protein [Candidatus Thorarchaeota archaeon]